MQLIYAYNFDKETETAETWLVLDFLGLANNTDPGVNVPLGIQRVDVSGPTRKTVQQTRIGSYVDAWDIGPNNIVVSGSVAIPEGYNTNILKVKYGGKYHPNSQLILGDPYNSAVFGTQSPEGTRHPYSVLSLIDHFYYQNSNQNSVQYDRMFWLDFNDAVLTPVTMTSRTVNVSVESAFIMNFQLHLLSLVPDTVNGRKSYESLKYPGYVTGRLETVTPTASLTTPAGVIQYGPMVYK